jgi:hypothetical protein
MYANEAIKISRGRGSNYKLKREEKPGETHAAPAIHAF